MIKGYCFTNLDKYQREKWPHEFVAVPREGEVVEAQSGKILKVVRVTHSMCANKISTEPNVKKEPIIKIELWKLT